MIITYIGNLSVKAQVGDKTITFNPPMRNDGTTPRTATDIAIFSYGRGGSVLSDEKTLLIDGPGEYEAGGIFIKGIGVEKKTEGAKKINTVYSVLFDDINLCHLGGIDTSDIKPEMLEGMGGVDIIFVPVTGGDVATPSMASKIATSFEPHIIVPMYSNDKGEIKDALKNFLKEEGSEDAKPQDKLTIKKKDIEGREGEIEILIPQI